MSDELSPGIFCSWRSYWDFARSVSSEARYVRTPKTEHFLACVLDTTQNRRTLVAKGRLFWRAQHGHAWRAVGDDHDELEIPCAYPVNRMKPLPNKAWDGRANSRGIPCLYLATSKETAMSEVRPWIGSYVSVGQLRTLRDLHLVDCGRHQTGNPIFLEEPDPAARVDAVWNHIEKAFSEPMTRSDDAADYAPTQILAELFKQAGFDGVIYRSNFGQGGFNIALFNLDDAALVNCGLFEVTQINPEFKQADDFYQIASPSL